MRNTIEAFFFSILYPIIIVGIFPQIAWILAKKLDDSRPLPDPMPAQNPLKFAGFWLANSFVWFSTLLSIFVSI